MWASEGGFAFREAIRDRFRSLTLQIGGLVCFVVLIFWTSNVHGDARGTSIGIYFSGCVLDPARLPREADGLLKVNRSRGREYGNPKLVELLLRLGKEYQAEFQDTPVERIQIGDMTDQMGGKQSDHHSHQNGLDVDIVYLRKHPAERSDVGESFVSRRKVRANFDRDRNWWMMKFLIETGEGEVSRIFVDPAIKKLFCDHGAELEPSAYLREKVLQHLYPLNRFHDTHFHVRLKCPVSDYYCSSGPALREGDGCADLYRSRKEDGEDSGDSKVEEKRSVYHPPMPEICIQKLHYKSPRKVKKIKRKRR